MSFNDLLNSVCTIRRYTEGAADAYGNKTKTWTDHLVDTPCRQVYGKGREILVGAETIIIYDELFVGDVDVTTWDRVTIDAIEYDIIAIMVRQDYGDIHHKQCFLRRVE